MMTSTLDFHLPQDLHATHPPEKRGIRRDQVRMMVLNHQTDSIHHDQFCHLPNYLEPGDLIILNNSRTIPAVLQAELYSKKVEVRLARRTDEDIWEVLIIGKRVEAGDMLEFPSGLSALVLLGNEHSPLSTIQFSKKGIELFNTIYKIGEPIRYEYISDSWGLDYYQTVFASHPGSVEMPSAGRAFSWELLFSIMKKKINVDFIQLHTGLSYFYDEDKPLTPENNYEEYHISRKTMNNILETKAAGNRVIAVGTTVVRALESAARSGVLSGSTNLYITPHTHLKVVDGIITGFHEPKASHLDMLTAFVSKQQLLQAYEKAIQSSYLWHEFGDMNLII